MAVISCDRKELQTIVKKAFPDVPDGAEFDKIVDAYYAAFWDSLTAGMITAPNGSGLSLEATHAYVKVKDALIAREKKKATKIEIDDVHIPQIALYFRRFTNWNSQFAEIVLLMEHKLVTLEAEILAKATNGAPHGITQATPPR